jgi:meso-butanediol dehydrogenase/(S,S)-butanediol dehydrogenase/diacetyl reductase
MAHLVTSARSASGVAVVTGAGRGIGREVAISLAVSGYDLALGWHHDKDAILETAELATAIGASVVCVQGDVAEEESATMLVAATRELGALEVWVNNAGVSVLAPILQTSAAEARLQIEVNYLGTFHGVVAAGRVMTEQGRGRIINIASDLGVLAAPLLAAYSASKFAVVGLTQAAAIELGASGVTVNAVCPGTVETDMVVAEQEAEARFTGATISEIRSRLQAAVPAGRLCTPGDVADVVSFLASPAAAYLTGQAICVNGGSVLH